MLTHLYLIRHGETEGAETRRYKGHLDVPLSDNGVQQMKRLAGFIAGAGLGACPGQPHRIVPTKTLTAVYCSDLSRAIKSAEIIAEPHGLKPVIIPGLRERSFGVWEGMSFDEIRQKWPDAFNSWAANPLKYSPMEGESTIEVRDRVMNTLNGILNGRAGEEKGPAASDGETNIAIVSHGGVNRVLICELLGIPLEDIFRVDQDFGCLNVIELWDNYPIAKLINFTV